MTSPKIIPETPMDTGGKFLQKPVKEAGKEAPLPEAAVNEETEAAAPGLENTEAREEVCPHAPTADSDSCPSVLSSSQPPMLQRQVFILLFAAKEVGINWLYYCVTIYFDMITHGFFLFHPWKAFE